MPTAKAPPAPIAEWVKPFISPDAPGDTPPAPTWLLHVVDGAGDRQLTKEQAMREIYDARQTYHDRGDSPLQADADLAHIVAAHDAAPADA